MDEDLKKKKKNKKKKNKNAQRQTEHVTLDEREVNPGTQSSVDTGQDSDSQVSVSIDAGGDGRLNGTAKNLPKAEEKFWLDREASLEARINQLLKDKDDYLQREVTLEEKIQQLYDEKNESIRREGILEERIQQIQKEIEVHQQKSNSDKETIASMISQNTRLQAQVIELKHLSDSLIEEKKMLTGIISSLESQKRIFEVPADAQNSSVDKKMTSEDGIAVLKIGAGDALPENSEHTEKLHSQPDVDGSYKSEENIPPMQGPTSDTPRGNESVLVDNSSVGDHDTLRSGHAIDKTPEASKMMAFSSSAQSLEDVMLEDEDGRHLKDTLGHKFGLSFEIEEANDGNIVPVPSKEGEVKQNMWEATQNEVTTEDVPLTDAPLIGAPFRFISFVARYVSGADLVAKSGQRPG